MFSYLLMFYTYILSYPVGPVNNSYRLFLLLKTILNDKTALLTDVPKSQTYIPVKRAALFYILRFDHQSSSFFMLSKLMRSVDEL